MEVLDDRDLERLALVDVEDDRRYLVQPGQRRRARAPLARHQLEAAADAPYQDRLQDAPLADAGRELTETGLRDVLPRLSAVVADRPHGDGRDALVRRLRLGLGDPAEDRLEHRGTVDVPATLRHQPASTALSSSSATVLISWSASLPGAYTGTGTPATWASE